MNMAYSKAYALLFFLGTFLFLCNVSTAQQTSPLSLEPGKYYHVAPKYRAEFKGKYLEKRDSMLVFQDSYNKEILILSQAIEDVKPYVPKVYTFANPNPHMYLLNSSAISIKKRNTVYQSLGLTYHNINYGINNYISAGVGIDLYSLFSENKLIVFSLRANGFKLTENMHFGVGSTFYISTEERIRYFFSQLTIGNADANITFAYGRINRSNATAYFNKKHRNRFSINGMFRLSNRLMLITENNLLADEKEQTYSGGLRIIWKDTNLDFMILHNNVLEYKTIPVIGFGSVF